MNVCCQNSKEWYSTAMLREREEKEAPLYASVFSKTRSLTIYHDMTYTPRSAKQLTEIAGVVSWCFKVKRGYIYCRRKGKLRQFRNTASLYLIHARIYDTYLDPVTKHEHDGSKRNLSVSGIQA
jgi:hypothetical protein